MVALRPTRCTPLVAIAAAAITAVLAGCGTIPQEATTPVAGRPTRSTAPSPLPSAATSTAAGPPASVNTRPAKKPSATPSSSTPVRSQPKHKQSAATTVIFRPGDNRAAVRELQARLAQLAWYHGRITEHYGTDTTTAVKGFQQKRKLAATGMVDRNTWSRLVGMTHQPTHDQMYNIVLAGPPILKRGDQNKQVRELQARLEQLDWYADKITGFYGPVTAAAVRGFQDKRGLPTTGAVDRTTWSRLVSMTHEPTDDELSGDSSGGGVAVSHLDRRCLTGRAMCIDKTTQQLVWVIDGKPQLHFDVRFGADTTPTREGSFRVGWKARHWTSTLYHSEMPYSMFFSGGQAVHYSSDFAARGYYGASHGCVNVRDLAGIETLFDQARVGDKVIVYRS